MAYFDEIEIESKEQVQFFDITEQVKDLIRKSGIKEGSVLIQSNHTTAGLYVNEGEENLLKDFKNFLEKKAPRKNNYLHDDTTKRECPEDEPINAHSHIMAALYANPSVTLIIHDGELRLGKWQKILFGEFDGPCPRKHKDKRKCSVLISGD